MFGGASNVGELSKTIRIFLSASSALLLYCQCQEAQFCTTLPCSHCVELLSKQTSSEVLTAHALIAHCLHDLRWHATIEQGGAVTAAATQHNKQAAFAQLDADRHVLDAVQGAHAPGC